MRFFILTLCLFLPLSTAQACDGFNNALGALEHAVKQNKPIKTTSAKAPPIAAINRAIDNLEIAIEKDRRAKAAQTHTPQNPHL